MKLNLASHDCQGFIAVLEFQHVLELVEYDNKRFFGCLHGSNQIQDGFDIIMGHFKRGVQGYGRNPCYRINRQGRS